MSEKVQQIVDLIKNLSLMEAADVAKQLKEELNLPDAAPMAFAAAPAAGGAAAAEEQTEFTVSLDSAPADKKIAVLKVVREITGLGLGEAKTFVESLPKPVKENVSKEEATSVKKKLEEAGGVCSLK